MNHPLTTIAIMLILFSIHPILTLLVPIALVLRLPLSTSITKE